jgi:hypothetical protein
MPTLRMGRHTFPWSLVVSLVAAGCSGPAPAPPDEGVPAGRAVAQSIDGILTAEELAWHHKTDGRDRGVVA